MHSIRCQKCKITLDEGSYRVVCSNCGGSLEFHYARDVSLGPSSCNSIWKYRDFLPVRQPSKIVSLQEGLTPLQKTRFHEKVEVYLKNETVNPTGSHKDRALSIGVTKALEFGFGTVMLYSDGSTALASAAYAARAGLRNITVMAPGAPDIRLLPLMIYDSIILEYQGNPAEALEWVHQACHRLGIYETSTYRRANPYESEGPKTIGFELFEQLGRTPDWVIVPVGGGATLAGIWRAFLELESLGLVSKKPRMVGVLPEGYDILETAMARDVRSETAFRSLTLREAPSTLQVKIAMPCPPDGLELITAIRESNGLLMYARDEEALDAQKKLGAFEGIYAEPSAAVSWVAVEKIRRMEKIGEGDTVVAIITGSGFRETGVISDRLKIKKLCIEPRSGIATLEKILNKETIYD
jgi:threonine synthase